jgi:hypothetical protein
MESTGKYDSLSPSQPDRARCCPSNAVAIASFSLHINEWPDEASLRRLKTADDMLGSIMETKK